MCLVTVLILAGCSCRTQYRQVAGGGTNVLNNTSWVEQVKCAIDIRDLTHWADHILATRPVVDYTLPPAQWPRFLRNPGCQLSAPRRVAVVTREETGDAFVMIDFSLRVAERGLAIYEADKPVGTYALHGLTQWTPRVYFYFCYKPTILIDDAEEQ